MKRFAAAAVLVFSALLGALRFVDLVLFTSLDTGFVTSGSVYLRYAAAAAGLLMCALLLIPKRQVRADAFCGSGLWFVCLEGMLCQIFGVFLLFQVIFGEFSVFELCKGITLVFLGVWCFYSAVYALRLKAAPKHGTIAAAIGGCVFFVMAIESFLLSPSSLHRVWPALDVLAIASALLLYATIFKAVYQKNEARPYRRLAFFGASTFLLSTCVQAPCAIYLFTKDMIHINTLALSVILAVFGVIGAVTAQHAMGD